MPLISANYSGGIIITDWYNDGNANNQSIKITIRFLSNEIRVDALNIKIFTKNCPTSTDCKITENKGNLIAEIKKSILGQKSKANHLTYIGDSRIGNSVNIGAGTITCNYDGYKKNKTTIKDNAFIGSNSSLVAPVIIGEKSIVGAGSVVTKNVKKKSLALTRTSQIEVKNYSRKKK